MKTKNLLAMSVAAALAAPFSAVAQDADEDGHHEIDQIVVTATPMSKTVEEWAQPTTVLFGDELAKKQSTSIGETLSHEVGVSSTYFGPIASRPVIRGQYGERVSVLSNGLDSLDASAFSDDHQTTVESLLARRIEIIRGPATLLYGSGAAGGLVNVVDTRFVDGPQDGPFSGALAMGADSAVGNRDGAVRAYFGTENVVFSADYFYRQTDNIEIPGYAESAALRAMEEEEEHEEEEGEEHEEHEEEEEQFGSVENTDSETEGGALGVNFLTDNGVIALSFSGLSSDYGIPGHHHHHEEEHEEGEEEGEEHDEEEEENVRLDLEQRRFDALVDLSFDGFISGMKLRAGLNDYEHVEMEGDEIGTIYEVDGFDGRLELQHAPIGIVEGAFGLQYKLVEFGALGEEAFVPPSDTEQMSVFLYEEFKASDSIVLQGSARVEEQTITGPTLAEDYDDSAVSLSLGAIWRLSDSFRISASAALTERHPTATELYADGGHVAVQRYERGSVTLGNGILSKEESTNFDVTLHGDGGRLEWEITGFINSIDDYIVLRPTGEEIDELPVYDFEQTDAEFVGLEAQATVELMDDGNNHWHARLFTDYVVAEESDGSNLPRIPPQRFGLGLHGGWNQFDASIDAIFASEQDDVAENELPTDSYTSLDLSLGYTFANSDLYMFLRGTNLLDEDIRQHSSALKDLIPLPGRSVHLGLRFDF